MDGRCRSTGFVAGNARLKYGNAVPKRRTPRWVFGYGSLIWRVDFPFLARRRAVVTGWARRFWQGSHDHRGTPDAPGRVVTLIPEPGTRCVGMAYLVDEGVFDHLDYREKNGYERIDVEARTYGAVLSAVTYVGQAGNFAWLGPAPMAEIAGQIAASEGPSGTNVDYLLELADALARLGAVDVHVQSLAARCRRLRGGSSPDGAEG